MPANRRAKEVPFFIGVSLEQWRSNKERLEFAQRNAVFREIVSVVHHESPSVLSTVSGCSGERAFGRVEGYQMAVAVLSSMSKSPDKAETPLEPTFDEHPNPKPEERI